MPPKEASGKIDKSLIGAAGVYYVASELSRRGLIALPTIRNTAGIDLIAANKKGTWHANIQVKTSSMKVAFWPVGQGYQQWQKENDFYTFVRYLKNESRFEVFLESADRVSQQLSQYVRREKELGHKDWAPCWYLPKDNAGILRLHRQWLEFGATIKSDV
jgi:hypothetical protein